MHSSASGAFQWRKVGHHLSVAFVCAVLLLDLGLLSMHITDYRLFPTRGDSMEPTSSSGSLLITHLTAPEDIRSSDFIVFPDPSETYPFIAHRVVVVGTDGGRAVATTKGDNNPVVDPERVTLDKPVARVVLTIPWVGRLVTLKTAWRLLGISALLGFKIALPWLAERRTTMVLASIFGPTTRGLQVDGS